MPAVRRHDRLRRIINALNEDVKLRISLELYLKRLIVGGLEKVYEIGRVFRNEGVDTRHNPEFTLMELYQAYTDYYGMMELTENMFRYLAEKVCGSAVITYNGVEIDLSKPFARLTMNDAIKKYAGIDFDEVKTDEEARRLQKSTTLNMRSATRRATSSTCSLRNTARRSSFADVHHGPPAGDFSAERRRSRATRRRWSALSCSSTRGKCATRTPS